MAVIRETPWLNGDEHQDLQAVVDAACVSHATGRCIGCGAEQPDDMAWPAFAFQLRSITGGEPTDDVTFTACPRCEPRMDAIIGRLGG